MAENINFSEDFKKIEKAKKREERKEKIKQKISKVTKWTRSNMNTIVTVGAVVTPVLVATVTTAGKLMIKHKTSVNLAKTEELKTLYCYDRSLGMYWKLKRPLSSSEWLTINARKKMGETLADILSDLNVLA